MKIIRTKIKIEVWRAKAKFHKENFSVKFGVQALNSHNFKNR